MSAPRRRAAVTLPGMQTPPSEDAAPRRLNLKEFAQRRRSLQGSVAVAELPRLAAALHADAQQLGRLRVHWSLRGTLRSDPAGAEQALVSLRVKGELPMTCQRCLQASEQAIDDEVTLRLVDEEPELGTEELESPEESFCARHPVDVLELVEDQLILALPLVPMHARCPQPLPAGDAVQRPAEAPAQSPFAVLAGLRKPGAH